MNNTAFTSPRIFLLPILLFPVLFTGCGSDNNTIHDIWITTEDALNREPDHITVITGETYADNTGPTDQTYDARGWSTASSLIYPVKIGNNTPGTRQVWVGGEVTGQQSRSTTWKDMKASYDGAGILIQSGDYLVVDGLRTDNVMDAIRPRSNTSTFRISNIYATYTRDDAIENDNIMGGLISDCLFDGCFMFLSQQGTDTWAISTPLEVADTLVRLEPMPYDTNVGGDPPAFEAAYGVNADRHAQLFKHHGPGDAPLKVHDCIFYVPQLSVNGTSAMAFPEFDGCTYENNILLWTGGGSYPGSLPASGVMEYNLVNSTQIDIDQIWDDAVSDWLTRHGY